jgi:hypothetical protein
MIDYRADVIGRQIRALRGRSDNWDRIYALLVEARHLLDNAGWNERLQRYSDLKPLLQDFALATFDEREVHDASSMSYWLAGSAIVGSHGQKAYRTVAEDLLGVLARQGLIEKDTHGWVEDHERDTVG